MTVDANANDFRFQYDRMSREWVAEIQYADSLFGTSCIRLQITDDETAKRLRPDQIALVARVVRWLPDLMPMIAQYLAEYDPTLNDPATFREVLREPSVCLFDPQERPSHSWTFTVERPSFEGDNFGYHLEFVEKEFKGIWAGD